MRIAAVGNGRSVHVAARSAALAARGHDVRLVTLGPVVEAPGVEVRTRTIPTTLAASFGAARGFLRDVREFGPDLLHLHYAGGKLGTLALLSGVWPLVVTVMGGDVLPEQHPGGHSRLERRSTRRILQAADLVLVKSDALRAAALDLGAEAGRLETVRWGVDPALFHPDPAGATALRERLGLAESDRVLLSPRLLAPLYNIHLVVQALPAVLAGEPRAVLLVTEYGAAPGYRQHIEERAAQLGVAGRVRFIGRFDHAQMPALFSLADVVVSVPASDGLPQSLFEAMACEAAVVLGRLDAYEEAVRDGETALMADFTAEGIATAVLRLLQDDGLRKRLVAAGRRRVAEIASLPRDAERVELLYRRVLESPVPRRRGILLDGRLFDALGLLVR